MNILHLTTGYPRFTGDTFGTFIEDLVREQAKSHSATVLAPQAEGFPSHEQRDGVSIFRLNYFPGRPKVAYGSGIPTNLKLWSCRLQLPFFFMGMGLQTLMHSSHFDVLHAHWGVSGLMALPSHWFRRLPLVISFHGSDLHGALPIQKTSRFMAHRSDANVCVSKEQINRLPPGNHHVISYGIDTQRFQPVDEGTRKVLRKSLGLPQDRKIAIFVGYLIPLKGVDFLISLLKDQPDYDLLVVGDGEMRSILEAQAEGTRQRVHFVGTQPYHEIHRYFQACDLHLMASEREGKPNVIFQAMACGLPTISTAVGGIPEQILHDQTGILCDERKAETFHNALEMISNDTRREEMGRRARERLLSLGIDLPSIARQHDGVYAEVLGKASL